MEHGGCVLMLTNSQVYEHNQAIVSSIRATFDAQLVNIIIELEGHSRTVKEFE